MSSSSSHDSNSNSSSSSSRHVFYLVPTSPGVGLTSVALGLYRALDRRGLSVGFFKPIRQPSFQEERSTQFLRAFYGASLDVMEPWDYFGQQQQDVVGSNSNSNNSNTTMDTGRLFLQEIVERFAVAAKNHSQVMVVEGLQPTAEQPELEAFNQHIVKALDAEVIIVTSIDTTCVNGFQVFQDRIEKVVQLYGGMEETTNTLEKEEKNNEKQNNNNNLIAGCIINKFNAPTSHISGAELTLLVDEDMSNSSNSTKEDSTACAKRTKDAIALLQRHCPKLFSKNNNNSLEILGIIPWEPRLLSCRTYDMAQHLGAEVRYAEEMRTRRVQNVKIIARSVRNMTGTLRPDTLVCTPGDRDDIILAVAMAALNGVPLAGILLTGGIEPDPAVLKLCDKAFTTTGLPLLFVDMDSYVTAATAASIDPQVPINDLDRIRDVMEFTAERLCLHGHLLRRIQITRQPRLSPAAFMYLLVNRARESRRRILLPEGNDPRIIKAAAICHQRNICSCVLLGDVAEIHRLADAQGVTLPSTIQIIPPSMETRMQYVDAMVQLRKHKGLTQPSALAQLEDVSVLGTMMLATGQVDGLVSGACHSTANTVRPALQLIKTRPDAQLISSVFFMCLPNQVVIYGDCAINPDPNAQELADIALQSAASAKAFGIAPVRVAMISYSTGTSGRGSDVDKVREATRIAQERAAAAAAAAGGGTEQEEIDKVWIDGPMQYDAACSMDVAKSKAPNSPVAGRANVLVFPDLNTGNTTYKAVQRTANVVAIGPMLQGLRRPVNDLSRGALVDDIVYTIALTCIQAGATATAVGADHNKEVVKSHHKRTVSLPVSMPGGDAIDGIPASTTGGSSQHKKTVSSLRGGTGVDQPSTFHDSLRQTVSSESKGIGTVTTTFGGT